MFHRIRNKHNVLIKYIRTKTQNINFSQRFLDTWSSYSSCNSWISDSSWLYLNDSCVSASTSTVSSDSYISSESKYCSNYSTSGELMIGNTFDSFLLSPLSGVSYKDHPIWYWRILNPFLTNEFFRNYF